MTIYTSAEYTSELTIAEMAATYLKDVGIKAKVEVVEWGTFLSKFVAGEYPVWVCGEAPSGDPDDTYYIMHHCDEAWNYGDYCNPELDKLLEEGRRVSDPAERKEIYRQAEEILLQDVPLAWVILHHVRDAHQQYVKGFVHMGNFRYDGLIYTWLDR